jgi:hypothetical protein
MAELSRQVRLASLRHELGRFVGEVPDGGDVPCGEVSGLLHALRHAQQPFLAAPSACAPLPSSAGTRCSGRPTRTGLLGRLPGAPGAAASRTPAWPRAACRASLPLPTSLVPRARHRRRPAAAPRRATPSTRLPTPPPRPRTARECVSREPPVFSAAVASFLRGGRAGPATACILSFQSVPRPRRAFLRWVRTAVWKDMGRKRAGGCCRARTGGRSCPPNRRPRPRRCRPHGSAPPPRRAARGSRG